MPVEWVLPCWCKRRQDGSAPLGRNGAVLLRKREALLERRKPDERRHDESGAPIAGDCKDRVEDARGYAGCDLGPVSHICVLQGDM